MKIEKEEGRFDYMIRFLAVNSSFNSSTYIREVSNI